MTNVLLLWAMGQEILDPAPDTIQPVDIGNGFSLTVKELQQVYSELTGRTESLQRQYQVNHHAGFDDLIQLDKKIEQMQEQYNIISKNCSVTLFHIDDQKQAFSSFERFHIFDRTTLSPVENIRLQYNFLILLPQMNKPQSYQIEIDLHSRAAILQRASKEVGLRSVMFYELFAPPTGSVEIEYIDYTVARNFQSAVDHWFLGLPELDNLKYLNHFKRVAPHFAFTLRMVLILPFLYICYRHFSPMLEPATAGMSEVYSSAVATFGGMMIMYMVAGKLGSAAGEAVKRIQPKSYLNLTRGDEKAYGELRSANKKAWWQVGFAAIGAILIHACASMIVHAMGFG